MNIATLLLFSFIAAFIGTIFMTISQEIEIRVKKRPISYTPAIAAFRIFRLDFEGLSERTKIISSYFVHFTYGTALGFPLAFIYVFGVTNIWPAFIIYYIVILLQGWIIMPLLGISGPPWTWGREAVLTEATHKLVYSVSTVALFFYFV